MLTKLFNFFYIELKASTKLIWIRKTVKSKQMFSSHFTILMKLTQSRKHNKIY